MKLINSTSLPEWYGHNDAIRTGYRPPKESFSYCFKSVFRQHNESGNIFTHLIGFILFSILWFHTLKCNSYKRFEFKDQIVFSIFFASIITCFLMSTLFHIFQCHSRKVFKLFAKLDYLGITLLSTSSSVSFTYYAFHGTLWTQITYSSFSIILGSICITISMFDTFSNKEFQAIRGIIFLVKGLSGLGPFIHICRHFSFLDPIISQFAFKSLMLLTLMAILYVVGALIYIAKIPERNYPVLFDLWFNSHQIFHMFCIAGGLLFFHSLSLAAHIRLNFSSERLNETIISV